MDGLTRPYCFVHDTAPLTLHCVSGAFLNSRLTNDTKKVLTPAGVPCIVAPS